MKTVFVDFSTPHLTCGNHHLKFETLSNGMFKYHFQVTSSWAYDYEDYTDKWLIDIRYVHSCKGANSKEVEKTKIRLDFTMRTASMRGQFCCNSTLFHVEYSERQEPFEEFLKTLSFSDPKLFESSCRVRFDKGEIVGESPIYVDKHFLSQQSPVFERMFNGDFLEQSADEVFIPKFTRIEFLAFLRQLYQPHRPFKDFASLEAVLKIADFFDCQPLKESSSFALLTLKPHGLNEFKSFLKLAYRHKFIKVMSGVIEEAPENFILELRKEEHVKEFEPTILGKINDRIITNMIQSV